MEAAKEIAQFDLECDEKRRLKKEFNDVDAATEMASFFNNNNNKDDQDDGDDIAALWHNEMSSEIANANAVVVATKYKYPVLRYIILRRWTKHNNSNSYTNNTNYYSTMLLTVLQIMFISYFNTSFMFMFMNTTFIFLLTPVDVS